ncbi:flagellar motor protein MotB [Aquibacillus halophilus]|uniref:Flagellar motor protein MotB n=1 Tax=Aquibacillus halophilus TaxID=930132 RepID=A0A6A8DGI1_9BACI|nr:flagellar motor protein MotS [Aquibacillus halophilus]MRH42831.1 flagellar motor protein MotB [Aquibacillus halophilus]
MKLRRKKPIDKGSPKWMVTYADMVTLILVFFILLFSMSQIDLVKFQAVSESFRNRMIFDSYPSPLPMENPTEHTEVQKKKEGSIEHKNAPEEVSQKEDNQTDSQQQDSLDNLLQEVEAFLDENQLNNVISANRTDEGVVLILQEKVLFESAEVEILDIGKPFLDKIGTLLTNVPNQVRVEGHTDNRPISSYRFPSNWELSSARASSVIRHVIENSNIDPTRFIAAGYGDTRPLVENNSSENWSKNRRVEFVILELDNNN